MEKLKYTLRSIALENNLKGIKHSYEFFLLNEEFKIIYDYLKEVNYEYKTRNFSDILLLTEKEFFEIIGLLKKDEIFTNLKLKNYTKILITSDPRHYFTNDSLPLNYASKNIIGIKAYSKKNEQYLFSLTLDKSDQKLLLSNIEQKEGYNNKALILNQNLIEILKNSYYYLKFNFKKFTYKLEIIDPFEYLVDENQYFDTI